MYENTTLLKYCCCWNLVFFMWMIHAAVLLCYKYTMQLNGVSFYTMSTFALLIAELHVCRHAFPSSSIIFPSTIMSTSYHGSIAFLTSYIYMYRISTFPYDCLLTCGHTCGNNIVSSNSVKLYSKGQVLEHRIVCMGCYKWMWLNVKVNDDF